MFVVGHAVLQWYCKYLNKYLTIISISYKRQSLMQVSCIVLIVTLANHDVVSSRTFSVIIRVSVSKTHPKEYGLKFVLWFCNNEHSISKTNWFHPCEGAVNKQHGTSPRRTRCVMY